MTTQTAAWFPQPVSPLLIVEALGITAITVTGILVCYRANRSGDNKEFIDRMICIGWPVGIRVMVITVSFVFLYLTIGYIVAGDTFDSFAEEITFADVSMIFALTILYYLWIRAHIVKVSAARS